MSQERPSADELWMLRELAFAVDEALEHSLLAREGLDQVFERLFPLVLSRTGARGVAVTTLNEQGIQRTWARGSFGGAPLALDPGPARDAVRLNGGTLSSQNLDVVGTTVGQLGLWFEGDRTAEAAPLARMRQTICEALDTVLEGVLIASEKQKVTLEVSERLGNSVFEAGLDQAIACLAGHVRLPGFLLVWRDAVETNALHYRSYREGRLEFSSAERPDPQVDQAIAHAGVRLVSREDLTLRRALEPHRTVEAVLVSSVPGAAPLGKILVWSESAGFSAFAMDVLHLLAATLSQRLIDYNRERIHLSQFFSCSVIDELVRISGYEARYLEPREEEVGILFADINAFTRICEKVLETPVRIGRFVDRWSAGVVELLWKHGGVFDKMVGDCVIGLFGPPFFRTSPHERAVSALKAAVEIQAFTAAMSADPEVAKLEEAAELPGLGVAVGVNLARAFCGVFGPNHSYTGFSSGMNQTARLQALGTFREILVMESVRQALGEGVEPFTRGLSYGPVEEKHVKNVGQPLRYHRLLGIAVRP